MRRFLPLVLLALLTALPARGQGYQFYVEAGRTVGMVIGDLNERHQQVLARRTPLVDDRSRAGPLIGFGATSPYTEHVYLVAGFEGGSTHMYARAFNDDGSAEGEGTLRFVGAHFRFEVRPDTDPWQVFIAFGLGGHYAHVRYEADYYGPTGRRREIFDGTALIPSQDAVLGVRRRTGRFALSAEGGYRVGRSTLIEVGDYLEGGITSISGHVFLLRVEWLYKPIRARQERP